MFVSVFGSDPESDFTELSSEWQKGASLLGEIIVESGATLVVSSENHRTVDFHAVQGALSVAKTGRAVSIQVHTYHRASPEARIPYEDLRELTAKDNLQLEFVFYERTRRSDGHRPLHVGQVASSDCTVFLGGRPGLINTANYALDLGLKVIEIGAYGGMAKSLESKLRHNHSSPVEFAQPIRKEVHGPLLRKMLTSDEEAITEPEEVLVRLVTPPAEDEGVKADWTNAYGGTVTLLRRNGSLLELCWKGGSVDDVIKDAEGGKLALGTSDAVLDELLVAGDRVFTYTPAVALPEEFDLEPIAGPATKTVRQGIKVLVIVATDIEKRAILMKLSPMDGHYRILELFTGRRTFYFGKLGRYNVAITDCSMGTGGRQGSLITSVRAIEDIKPKAVFMVGIAFGMDRKRQQLGDVLVAESIFPYEIARLGKATLHRGTSVDCDLGLASLLQSAAFTWHFPVGLRRVAVHRGVVLSGEKLVANKKFKRELCHAFPLAKGGEMEGAGVYWAAVEAKVPAILIKSICDWADSTKNDVAQPFAAVTAVSFLEHALSRPSALHSLRIPEA